MANKRHLQNVWGKLVNKIVGEDYTLLPRGENLIVKADDDNHDRGLVLTLQDTGGYKLNYWYGTPDKIYPVEVVVDG